MGNVAEAFERYDALRLERDQIRADIPRKIDALYFEELELSFQTAALERRYPQDGREPTASVPAYHRFFW